MKYFSATVGLLPYLLQCQAYIIDCKTMITTRREPDMISGGQIY